MNALFAYTLEMSVAGSIAAVFVLLFRFFLKKAPKWIRCSLWALVAIRLLFPFSVETPLSFSPVPKEEIHNLVQESFPDTEKEGSFWENVPLPSGESDSNTDSKPIAAPEEGPYSPKNLIPVIWILGAVTMLVLMGISFVRLKMKMSTAIPYSKGIKQSELVESPFILGVLKPVIYLPFGMDDWTKLSVVAHEKAHLRRGDHLIKPFAWLLLSIHWFNPLFWLSYALLCKDIEAACDEKVLADMNDAERRDYARALLKCSTRSAGVYSCPLAFGELNVKERIKMTLFYKKPVFWVIVLSLVIAIIAAVGILTDPIGDKENKKETSESETLQVTDYPRVKFESADWWGALPDLTMTANAENTIYRFSYDQAVFREKAINKNDDNWSDPVMVAESMSELTGILDGCVKNGEQNKYMLEAVEHYFKQKATEFSKIYPADEAPDFFQNHVILLLFSRPQEICWYVNRAMLKETDQGNLQVILDLGNFFPNDSSMDIDIYGNPVQRSESLRFYWISREVWERHKDGKIEFKATTEYQPEWIRFENYLYENKDTGETYYVILRKNNYDEEPLSCSVNFGKTYLTKSRGRFLDFYKKVGYDDDAVLRGQAETCNFYYPAEKEDGILTLKQCAYKRSEDADVLATHAFRIKDGNLIYDEKASEEVIAGLPDGAVFTLKNPNF